MDDEYMLHGLRPSEKRALGLSGIYEPPSLFDPIDVEGPGDDDDDDDDDDGDDDDDDDAED